MKFEIFKFEKVTSTNDEAIKLITKEKKIAGCVYADLQTRGKGAHRKKWISEKGNLFSSIFFPLKKRYPPFEEFSTVNSILIFNIIKNYCNKKKINLKFPNDIFVNGKKICGILQEVLTFKSKKFLIIGIGINIKNNPKLENNYEATNIFNETEKKPKIDEINDEIIRSYEDFFLNLNKYNYINFKRKAELLAIN